jgi:ATP-dependent DNA helicase PIF1
MRDKEYHDLLSRARFGRLTPNDHAILASRRTKADQSETSATNEIKPTTLFPLRREAEAMNEREMQKLPGEVHTYTAQDEFYRGRIVVDDIPDSYVRMLDQAIPRVLRLKVGAQVMLKKNIDVEDGLANGTRGVVVGLERKTILIRTLSGVDVSLTPCEWDVGSKETHAKRIQFPLIMAWGLTIHSSQGATLDAVECDLGRDIFAAGQAYVALSRVKTSSGLKLIRFDPYSIKSDPIAMTFTLSLQKKCNT